MVKFARFGPIDREIPAVYENGTWFDLRPIAPEIDREFFETDGPSRAREALAKGLLTSLDRVEGDRIGAPIARPGKIVCIGLNYADHARETGARIPDEPVVFMKDPSCVVGPNDNVLIPPGSTKTDYEIELGVVIGREARYLSEDVDPMDYVAGLVISHDVSERTFQLECGGQWDKGKSCETFNPLGPYLVPVDEVADAQNLSLLTMVNGVERQNSSTSQMLFPVAFLIRYLSQFMVLRPGDLVNTGTPAGVAMGREDTPFLAPGDVVELTISDLGRAQQTFK